jgi:ribosomal protein S18 acetylase RimI-like enzyme
MNVISFVKAAPADIATIRHLADAIWHDHYPGIITVAQVEYMLDRMYAASTIEKEMDSGTVYEIILDNGAPAGFLSFTHDGASKTLKVHKLYLSVDRHGKGIGQNALHRLVETARGLGAAKLSLFVNKNNTRAIASYRRAGFETAESVVTDIGNGFVMDDFRMERNV